MRNLTPTSITQAFADYAKNAPSERTRTLLVSLAGPAVNVVIAAVLILGGAATFFAMYPESRVFHEDATGYELRGLQLASMWRGEYPPFRLDLGGSEGSAATPATPLAPERTTTSRTVHEQIRL